MFAQQLASPDTNPNILSLLLSRYSLSTCGVYSARAQACTSRLASRVSSLWTFVASTGCHYCNTSARRIAVSRARAASRSRGRSVGARRASCPVTPTLRTSTSLATPTRMATRRHLLLIPSPHKCVDTRLFDSIHLILTSYTYGYMYFALTSVSYGI